jgi:hypothetical protein
MARDTFSDLVPRRILNREDKGGTRGQTRQLARGSAYLMRDMLLNGILVSLGILERSSLEKLISSEETYKPTEEFALLSFVAIEAWAVHWQTQTGQLPAA